MNRVKIAVVMFLVISILFHSLDANAGKYSFLSKIFKQSDTTVRKLAKDVAPASRKLMKKADIRKIVPDIPLRKITPDISRIASMGRKFADQGKFATKFINSVPDPGEVLRQFSKYGPNYTKTAQKVSKSFARHSDELLALSKKAGKSVKLPFSAKTLPRFKNPKHVNEMFIRVLKRTGKKGYEITKKIAKWSADNPSKALGAVALAWFMIDREGFIVKLEESGKTLGEFITTIVGSVVAGAGHGMTEGIKKVLTSNNIAYVFFGFFVILVFLVRPVRRFAFIPFKIIGNKMDECADKHDSYKKPEKTSQTSDKIKKEDSSSPTDESGGSNVFD